MSTQKQAPYGFPTVVNQDIAQLVADLDTHIKNVAATINYNSMVGDRIVGAFCPLAQDTPNMTVRVAGGALFVNGALVETNDQNTQVISAPKKNPRTDRVIVNATTGLVSVLTGVENNVPAPPAVPAGSLPIARVSLVPGQASIAQAQIKDERVLVSVTASGTTTPPVNPPPPPPANSFFVSPSGNDNNDGSVNSPFLTLEKAQTAMRGSSTGVKTTVLKAGTYNRSGTLNLTSVDNGQTWQLDPGAGFNTATLDCGFRFNSCINIQGASNITINGIKIVNVGAYGILAGGCSNLIAENCEIGNIHWPGGGAMQSAGVQFDNCPNSKIIHNYVHDSVGAGITCSAFFGGGSIAGCLVDSNFIENTVTGQSDCGAFYANSRGSGVGAGTMSVTNNFIRHVGAQGVDSVNGLYVDDHASGYTMTGNIVTIPDPGITRGAGMIIHNGSSNICDHNIFDVSTDGGNWTVGVWFSDDGTSMAGNTFRGNIVVGKFTGGSSQEFFQNGVATAIAISNNDWTNFAGGSFNTTGPINSDSSPQTYSPAALKLSGWTYTLDAISPVFGTPMSFPAIVGGWGPPGFSIPQTGVGPSQPH